MHVLMVSTSYPRDAADWHGIFIRHLAAALARRADIQLDLVGASSRICRTECHRSNIAA